MKLIRILFYSFLIFVASLLSEVVGQIASLIIPYSYNLLRIILATVVSILSYILMYKLIAKKIIRTNFDWINLRPKLKWSYLMPVILELMIIYGSYMFIGIHYRATNVSSHIILTTTFITVLFSGVMAPFIEEITYRGIILQLFSNEYGYVVGIIIQSIFFTMAHFLNGGINGFPSVILFVISGILFGSLNGLLDYRNKSIWPGFVVHSIFNIIITFFPISRYNLGGWFFFYQSNSKNILLTGGSTGMQASIISILSSLLIIIINLMIYKNKKFGRNVR